MVSRSAQRNTCWSDQWSFFVFLFGGSEGWRRRLPCAPPLRHAEQESGGPHRHRIRRAEDKLPPKGLWTRGCPSEHAEGQTTGRSGRRRKSSSYRARRRHRRFFRRGGGIIGHNLISKPKNGWDSTAGSGRAHWPVRRPGEEGAPRIEHYIAQLGGSLWEIRDTLRVTRRWLASSPNLGWNGVRASRGTRPQGPRGRHASGAQRPQC